MAEHSDFKNYYRILEVSQEASAEEVKRAYRGLAKELHPDRHPEDPAATSKFQALNEAHAVLSDPEARARYDAACIAPEIPSAPRPAIDPIKCSSCGAVSAQPRYVIFWYVISLIFVTSRRTMQGVFCPSCASRTAVQASAITWLLGWWGFPWGPIWTIGALCTNLTGGTKPADVNAQILARQTLYFWDKGKSELAAAAVEQALRFKAAAALREHLSELKQALPPAPKAQLVDHWKLLRGCGFWVQLAPALVVVTLITWNNRADIMVGIEHQNLAHVGEAKSSVVAEPRAMAPVVATIRPFENFHVVADRGTEGYDRVVTSRGTVGFVPKSSIIYGDGMADLRGRCFPSGPVSLTNGMVLRQIRIGPHTLKTTNGLSTDAVVKVREMAGSTVLSFYVAAGGEVTINRVPEGTFIIEFATGRDFSPMCGYFLSNIRPGVS
jgi:DnaJ-like protein